MKDVAITSMVDLFLESDDDECVAEDDVLDLFPSIVERDQHPKIQNYAEGVVPEYSEWDFKRHFQVGRSTFEFILHLLMLSTAMRHEGGHGGRPPVPVYKQLLIALWTLATQETVRSIADRFGVAESTCMICYKKVCSVLVNDYVSVFIKFVRDNSASVSQSFFQKAGFPGVVGAIDGCHIPIKAPNNHPEEYINRKCFHSIILQGIVDNKMCFVDIFVGWIGSVHDPRVFKNSPFGSSCITDCSPYFQANNHIVGDAAYPLLKFLITPFRDTGNLSELQKKPSTRS